MKKKAGVYLGPAGQLIILRRSPLVTDYIVEYSEHGTKFPFLDNFIYFSIDGWEYLGKL